MREDDHGGRAGAALIVRSECASKARLHAEDIEVVRRDELDPSGARLAAGGEDNRAGIMADEISQRCDALAKVAQLEIRDRGEGGVRRGAADAHESRGVGDGERPKEEGIDEAEDREVGADAEGERADRNAGEDRGAPEGASGDSQGGHGEDSSRGGVLSSTHHG